MRGRNQSNAHRFRRGYPGRRLANNRTACSLRLCGWSSLMCPYAGSMADDVLEMPRQVGLVDESEHSCHGRKRPACADCMLGVQDTALEYIAIWRTADCAGEQPREPRSLDTSDTRHVADRNPLLQ